MLSQGDKMMNQKRTELKQAAAGLAVLLLAAAVLTGAAAAADEGSPTAAPSPAPTNPLIGGAFYYENVEGFDGIYKYLDNVIDLTYSNPKALNHRHHVRKGSMRAQRRLMLSSSKNLTRMCIYMYITGMK